MRETQTMEQTGGVELIAEERRRQIEGEPEEENRELRKMLWLNHGCDFASLYGDDGQMQCACGVDFTNDSVPVILAKWQRRRARVMDSAPAPASHEEHGRRIGCACDDDGPCLFHGEMAGTVSLDERIARMRAAALNVSEEWARERIEMELPYLLDRVSDLLCDAQQPAALGRTPEPRGEHKEGSS